MSFRSRGPRRRRRVPVDIKNFDYDYRNVDVLRFFVSDTGMILPRRRTGLTAAQQRKMARAIKQARCMSLLPYTTRQQQ